MSLILPTIEELKQKAEDRKKEEEKKTLDYFQQRLNSAISNNESSLLKGEFVDFTINKTLQFNENHLNYLHHLVDELNEKNVYEITMCESFTKDYTCDYIRITIRLKQQSNYK